VVIEKYDGVYVVLVWVIVWSWCRLWYIGVGYLKERKMLLEET
jgi:hypothetical protein